MSWRISDLLAAASLLLTILAVLYSVWYDEIRSAIEDKPQLLPANNKPRYDEMRATMWTRAVPLAAASIVAATIFAPDAVKLARPVLQAVGHFGRLPTYNAVSTALFAVTVGMVALAVHASLRAGALWSNRRKFDPTLPPPLGSNPTA